MKKQKLLQLINSQYFYLILNKKKKNKILFFSKKIIKWAQLKNEVLLKLFRRRIKKIQRRSSYINFYKNLYKIYPNVFPKIFNEELNLKHKQYLFDQEEVFLSSFILKRFLLGFLKKGKKFKSEKIYRKIFLMLILRGYVPINTIILAINNIKPLVNVYYTKKKR